MSREDYLAGYRWALEHLTDPGVLRDAALYAEERGGPRRADPEVPTASVEERNDGASSPSAPHGSTKAGQDFARLDIQPGQRVRVTLEADVLTVSTASANRGISLIRLKAGAGMCDGIWLVREPNFGEVLDVQIVGVGDA